jgi:hypothetical protein
MKSEILWQIIFWLAMGWLASKTVVPVLRLTVFLPYRTTLMTWWMKNFSWDYRTSKEYYDELIALRNSCGDSQEGGYRFFELLQREKRLRCENLATTTPDDFLDPERKLGTVSVTKNGGLSQVIETGHLECFMFRKGSKSRMHKISILFRMVDDIYPHSIELFYVDAASYEVLEKEVFPPPAPAEPQTPVRPRRPVLV